MANSYLEKVLEARAAFEGPNPETWYDRLEREESELEVALESACRLAGANYVAKPAWIPHVVTDGNLVTGQQSTSAQVTADAVMNLLKLAV